MVESFIAGFAQGLGWLFLYFGVRICQKAFNSGLGVRIDS